MGPCLNQQGRHWCLTLFVCTEWEKQENLIELFTKSGKILTYIFQLECCQTTSRKHWQIYLETSKIRFRTLKTILPRGCHIEAARNKQAARMYSMKTSTRISGPWHNLCDSDFKELEKKAGAGASIQEIYHKICEGEITNVTEVAHQSVSVFLRHERPLTSLISSRQKERSFKTVVIYPYGAGRVGYRDQQRQRYVKNHTIRVMVNGGTCI